jgi:acetyl-CoA carboxylase, biotin carboxylase subunit
MGRALAEMKLEGIKTTIPFHQKLIRTAAFETGDFYTLC